MEKLTVAMRQYLEVVYELSGSGDGARVSDIASRLKVTKASVNSAMKVLAAKGLVTNGRYQRIQLTGAGSHLARSALEKRRILRALLTEVMGVAPSTADRDAGAMEHALSTESAGHILTFLEQQGVFSASPEEQT